MLQPQQPALPLALEPKSSSEPCFVDSDVEASPEDVEPSDSLVTPCPEPPCASLDSSESCFGVHFLKAPSGIVTAARAASLFTDAEAAGATGVEDLARLGGKNANRSLRPKLLKQHLAQALLEQDSVLESQEADPGNGRDALFAPP